MVMIQIFPCSNFPFWYDDDDDDEYKRGKNIFLTFLSRFFVVYNHVMTISIFQPVIMISLFFTVHQSNPSIIVFLLLLTITIVDLFQIFSKNYIFCSIFQYIFIRQNIDMHNMYLCGCSQG